MSGFLQGYNTMDALAALAFGVTVVTAVRGLGYELDRVNLRCLDRLRKYVSGPL